MFLTPEFLVDPAARPDHRGLTGLALFLQDGVLLGRGMDRRGDCYDGPVSLAEAEAFARHVLVLPGAFAAAPVAPTPDDWWACLWAVERAHKAARLGQWEFVGTNADKAYAVERRLLPPDRGRDLAYAAARTAGAWGGRPGAGGVVLVAPPGAHEAIKKAAGQYL